MEKHIKSIIALSIVVFIPFALMVWYRTHDSSGFASIELIAYPLIFGGSSIAIIYLLKKYFLVEPLSDFNSGDGSFANDLVWGLVLTVVYFTLFFIFRATLMGILNFNSNQELLGLMLDMRERPILVMIWFGPVLWIGIALYEELVRIFILTNMWRWTSGIGWEILVIVFSSLIIGFAHWSQGSYGIVTIAIKSIVAGFFFYKKRRLMPLVYAHVLYDGLQVGMLLATYPNE